MRTFPRSVSRLAIRTMALSMASLFLLQCGGMHPDPMERNTNVIERIDSRVRESYPDDQAPGCAVLVLRDGMPLFSKGYGITHLQTGSSITPDTNFRLASVTKQFTAMAILILVDRDALSLEDTLCDLFPDFPPYGKAITVRHILNHTSGLQDYEDLLPEGMTDPILDAGVLDIMKAQSDTLFLPGSQYKYSNSGYAVLAMVVEARSGKRFAEFLRDEIFLPLGMSHTVAFEKGLSTVPHRAFGYKSDETGGWQFADQSLTSSVLGDGGIYTSLVDYAKWDAALYTEKLIPSELLAQAFTSGRLNDGTETGYGFGWRIDKENGLQVLHHTGGTTGFNNYVRRIPEKRLCVLILSNRNGEEPKNLAPQIETLVLNAE